MTFQTSDLAFMLEDFGVTVTPITWQTAEFKGIVDREYVDLEEVGRVRDVVTVMDSSLPTSKKIGDILEVNGTQYKCVQFLQEEPDITRIVLADV